MAVWLLCLASSARLSFGCGLVGLFLLWTSWLTPRSLTSLGVRIGVYLTGLDFIQFFLLLALCMGNGIVSLSGWCKADLHFAHIFSVGIRFMVDLLYLFFVCEVKAPKGFVMRSLLSLISLENMTITVFCSLFVVCYI